MATDRIARTDPAGARRGQRGGWAVGTWWAVVVVLVVATAASVAAPRVASAELKAALLRALSARHVQVSPMSAPPAALWWGRVDRLAVSARDLRAGAVEVRSFDATLEGVRLDPGALYLSRRITVTSLAAGTAHLIVSQEALSRALGSQPSLRDVVVTLGPDRVRIDATIALLGASLRASGDGRLVLRRPGVVDLALDRVTVAGVTLPDAVVGQLAGSLNPVFDPGPLPFGLQLVRISVAYGEVVLDAAATPR